MNIASKLIATTAAAVMALTLAMSLAPAAQAKISIVGHEYKPTQVVEAYDEPVCKLVKVKFVKEQYGRKIVTFKTKKVCA